MSNIAIEFENVSKQYRLGTIGTGTISHDLNRWWHLVRGKEDPYLKVGEVNDRSSKAISDYVWALKDINFKVEQGEVLGIIGKNGAGKSTLLKLLSRVTSPSTGQIRAKGRIASLLEVGTGFHAEMTGRENIYMNGAIMGMTRHEINSKLDEIVAFSGIERYIDTPVKRYSSGMTVRLGFAVAAHLEPEILVVDEVLAVGDAEFQKKAIGKMKDVSEGGGRTVLFVSHNMEAVRELCTQCVLLENGMVSLTGKTDYILTEYKKTSSGDKKGIIKVQNKDFAFLGFENEKELQHRQINKDVELELKFQTKRSWKNVFIDIGVYNSKEQMVVHTKAKFLSEGINFSENEFSTVSYCIAKPYLSPGDYTITLFVYNQDGMIYWSDFIPAFSIAASNYYSDNTIYLDDIKGIIVPPFSVKKK